MAHECRSLRENGSQEEICHAYNGLKSILVVDLCFESENSLRCGSAGQFWPAPDLMVALVIVLDFNALPI